MYFENPYEIAVYNVMRTGTYIHTYLFLFKKVCLRVVYLRNTLAE